MNRIKELRESKGVQQKEMAIDLGVTQPTISNWELGIKVPSAKNTRMLADYFGVSVDYLLGGDVQGQSLTDDEAFLLGTYRGFNGEGKQQAREFVTAMRRSGMYAAGTNYFAR